MAPEELRLRSPARERVEAAGVALTDARGFYEFAARLAARGESMVERRPPEDRHLEMLRLRLLEGLTLRETGERTGVGPERVRQLLNAYFGLRKTPRGRRKR